MGIKVEDLSSEFKYKQKTIKDLAQFIKIRTGNVPNYNILLGAGASVTSGIRSGQNLVQEWKKELFIQECDKLKIDNLELEYKQLYKKIENLEQDIDTKIINSFFQKHFGGEWFYINKEYSSLFEKKFDLPRQRRAFVEQEVRDASPSLGYAYLVSLIENQYFNTVFTTNFDDLINEAFFKFSETRPIICAHDSAISSITVTSPRPKIIKLHGDYLFDDIKTTISETESLQNNMKEKFTEFAKDYGLIVSGYSGCDRSIMDILELLQKNDNYYKHGIYWIFREGSEVSDDVRHLLRHDRVFYIISDGFDETFAHLHAEITNQDSLSLDSTVLSTNPNKKIIDELLKNPYLQQNNNPLIKKEYERLKNHNKEDNIIESLRKIGFMDAALTHESIGNQLNNQTLKNLFSIKYLIDKDDYIGAVLKLQEFLSLEQKTEAKVSYLKQILTCQIKIEDLNSIDSTINQLIHLDNGNPFYLLRKLPLIEDYDGKIEIINNAISKNPYEHQFYLEKAETLTEMFENNYDLNDRNNLGNQIISSYNLSIEKYPALKNDAWHQLALFLNKNPNLTINNDNEYINLSSILDTLERQNKYHHNLLRLKLNLISNQNFDDFIKELQEARDHSVENPIYLHEIHIQLLIKQNKFDDALSLLKQRKKEVDEDIYIKLFMDLEADIMIKHEADYHSAIACLQKQNILESSSSRSIMLIHYMIFIEDLDAAQQEFQKIKLSLVHTKKLSLQADLLFAQQLFHDGFELLDQITHKDENYYNNYVFNKLKQGEYTKARDLSRQFLSQHNFHPSLEILKINYLLAKYLLGEKIRPNKIQDIMKHSSDANIEIACLILLEDYTKASEKIINFLNENKSFIYELKTWPLFVNFRKTTEYQHIEKRYSLYFNKF